MDNNWIEGEASRYLVNNRCDTAVSVIVDIAATWDDKFVLAPYSIYEKDPAHGVVQFIRCCTDTPHTECYDEPESDPEPTPTARDLRPKYYFRVAIGDVLRGYGSDPDAPPWTARREMPVR